MKFPEGDQISLKGTNTKSKEEHDEYDVDEVDGENGDVDANNDDDRDNNGGY